MSAPCTLREWVVGRLLEAAGRSGMSDAEIAQRAGVHVDTVRRVFKGESFGPAVERVAEVLEVRWAG